MNKKMNSNEIKDALMKMTLKELYPYARRLGFRNLKAYRKETLCQCMSTDLTYPCYYKQYCELFGEAEEIIEPVEDIPVADEEETNVRPAIVKSIRNGYFYDSEELEEMSGAKDSKNCDDLFGDIPNKDRTKYLESAKDGTIVAFELPNGKVKSAAIVNNDVAGKRLLLETKYKKRFKASYKDVIWVRTGTRFPKGVYNLLKGNGVANGK